MTKRQEEAAFSQIVHAELVNAGLGHATLMSASPEREPFGDAEVVFRLDPMLLRVVRDRGQLFLDVGTIPAPTEFYQYQRC